MQPCPPSSPIRRYTSQFPSPGGEQTTLARLCWNFIDEGLARRLKIPLVTLEKPLAITALYRRALGHSSVTRVTSQVRLQLGNHCEEIALNLICSPEFNVVLGYPWLNRHNPHVDWVTGRILGWGPSCHATCLFVHPPFLPPNPPDPAELSQVPVEYLDLQEVFSKSRAATLPPHRSYDCSIELHPGTSPFCGRIFSLSRPE